MRRRGERMESAGENAEVGLEEHILIETTPAEGLL
jgi:hypothetical protein